MSRLPHRPRLALPFTVLSAPGRVRLVAGEEYRFTLTAPGLESWLPTWLPTLDGTRTLEEALSQLPASRIDEARQLLLRLLSERVLVEGPLVAPSGSLSLLVEGEGPLFERLRSESESDGVRVLCQSAPRWATAERYNAERLGGRHPWLWASTGALGRGYVSPVFLPADGPCLICLLKSFRRLSPMPELYEELSAHERAGGTVAEVPFPPEGVALLAALVRWKVGLLRAETAAVFRLHVMEVASLEVSSHEVLVDEECQACGGRR